MSFLYINRSIASSLLSLRPDSTPKVKFCRFFSEFVKFVKLSPLVYYHRSIQMDKEAKVLERWEAHLRETREGKSRGVSRGLSLAAGALRNW